jgi:type VI secretion system protein ImpG
VILGADALRPAGFGEHDGMLPYARRSFIGYRLLQEYFCFPQKFFFLDLTGLERICEAGFGGQAEILLMISPFERAERRQLLELGVGAKTFRLNCAPIVNLFAKTAEPILLDHTAYEYQVVPDVSRRRATEIFEITEVKSANPQSGEVVQYEPFYSYRHGVNRSKTQAFWRASRRASGLRRRRGHDCSSLVIASGRCGRTWMRSPCAPSALIGTCPRGCRSVTKAATSNWKARCP